MLIGVASVAFAACGPGTGPDSGTESESTGESESDSEGTTAGPGTESSSSSTDPTNATSTSTSTSTSTTSTTDTTDPPEPGLEWYPCPVFTGGGGTGAECVGIDVPLDWDDPDGETIELFVKRVLGGQPGPQVWFLMGGPGGAGNGFEAYADYFTGVDPTWSVYMLDHRGTGRSTRLGCDAEGNQTPGGLKIEFDEWPGCIDDLLDTWGEGLAQFNTTNAAHDLGWLIGQTQEPGYDVHVHGGSYGSYWAHRYLQIYPDQADSASLLGMATPDFTFVDFPSSFESVGRGYMEACGADGFCSGKLGAGTQPVTTMENVMDALEQGHCPEAVAAGLDRETLRTFFGRFLGYTYAERAVIPATVYRLDRCNPQDIEALEHLGNNMVDPLDALLNDPLWSSVINRHIRYGEMYDGPHPSVQELQDYLDNAIFAMGSTEGRELFELWPTYEEDEYAGQFADTNLPLLMLNGEFDAPTSLEQSLVMGEHFNGPNQHFVEIPGGSHTWDSPVDGGSCALSIFYFFVGDPTAPLFDCLGDIYPLDFTGTPEMAQAVFAKDDLWEG